MQNETLFFTYAQDYDRLQPLQVEMYQFYHELAVDMIPFDTEDEFQMLELGCGPGSTIHRLFDDNKAQLFKEIYDVLALDGWYFLIDPMSTRFDDVFRPFKQRQHFCSDASFKRAGVDIRDAERINMYES